MKLVNIRTNKSWRKDAENVCHVQALKISEKFLAARVERRRSNLVIIRVLIEVSGVSGRANFRNDGSGHGPGDQSLPVESLEPLVLANVGCARLQVAETFGTVGLQKPARQGVSGVKRKRSIA